jgi:hypothetical protein
MIMKTSFLISLLILTGSFSLTYAQVYRGFSLGASGGYTNYQTFTAEGFIQMNLRSSRISIEPKIGITGHSFTATYDNIDNLDVNNIGIFIEGAVYPFRDFLFVGARWEILNLNWFTRKSLDQIDNLPASFWGTSIYGVIGMDIPISRSVNFRVYGTPGVHLYQISDWQLSGQGFELSHPEESFAKFAFQVNASMVVKLSHERRGDRSRRHIRMNE